jgi:hypothetical protein
MQSVNTHVKRLPISLRVTIDISCSMSGLCDEISSASLVLQLSHFTKDRRKWAPVTHFISVIKKQD